MFHRPAGGPPLERGSVERSARVVVGHPASIPGHSLRPATCTPTLLPGAQCLLVVLNLAIIFLIHYSTALGMGTSDRRIFTGIFLGGILALFADSFALAWIGMESGLRGRLQSRAVLATLCRVLLPNWLCAFLLVFVAQSGKGISDTGWAILITCWFLLGFGIDLVLGRRAKQRLQRRFREFASGPLSKVVKGERADSTAALSFGERSLNSALP